MKHTERWKPSKFVLYKGKLYASRNRAEVSLGSRFRSDRTAEYYQRVLTQYTSGSLLDLGCGKVPLYEVYRQNIYDSICADWANSLHTTIHLDLVLDLNSPLPYSPSSFDTVLMTDVLEHVYRPQQLISEVTRILRPNGKIIIGVPFLHWLHETPHDHFRYTRYSLERMCIENGLELVTITETGGFPEVIVDLCAKVLQRWSFSVILWYGLANIAKRTFAFRLLSGKTQGRFPLGYVMVARKPS